MKIVGERLRTLRESKGLSQKRVAKLFDVGQSSIFRYEKGESSAPYHILNQTICNTPWICRNED